MKFLRWLGRTIWDWLTVERCTCIALPGKPGGPNHTVLRDPFCASSECIFRVEVKA